MATNEDITAKADSIKAGYEAATGMAAGFEASLPCHALLRTISAENAEGKRNVEDLLKLEGIARPSQAQRCGKFIELLREITKDSGNPLGVIGGRVAYFNGKFWEYLGQSDFAYFMTQAAALLGVDHYNSIYIDFIKKAVQSFEVACRAEILPKAAASMLNCSNGTVCIAEDGTAELRPHSAKDGLLYVLPYDYNPEAKAPRWRQFLQEVLPDEADRANLQEFCGSLFSAINHEKLCYLYGATGRNGKTTAKDIICAALGAANVSNESLSSLTERGGTGEAARAALEGKLLNACGEVEKQIDSSSMLKQIASRERLSVRPPYQTAVHEISDYARLLFCANDLPVFKTGAASAEARRFLFIEFAKRIPKDQVDRNLARDIIAAELPGVLNWMVEGLARLQANRGAFTPNAHAEFIKAQFLEGSNSVYAYLRQYGFMPATEINKQRHPGGLIFKIETTTLYGGRALDGECIGPDMDNYTQFCRMNGRMPQGRNTFQRTLQQLGFNIKKSKAAHTVELYQMTPEDLEKYCNPQRGGGTLWEQ